MVLVDGAPSTMTYLPTKFTIVLGRDDDVRHAGLWYMHLVRFGHGKFLIVSAADLQKHDRDTHAAVYISQTSHRAHAERLLFDTGNKFGHVWADMGDVNGFSPNTGDVLASQRRFTLANGDAGGASCQFESILYAEPSIPLHTVTNYGIAMAPRTLVCALQPGATAPFTSENLAPPAKTDTDVIAACFADTVIGSGVPNITNAGREPFVISIDSAPGYDGSKRSFFRPFLSSAALVKRPPGERHASKEGSIPSSSHHITCGPTPRARSFTMSEIHDITV